MSNAIYLNMFQSSMAITKYDRKRRRRQAIKSRLMKACGYGLLICGIAWQADNFFQYASVSAMLCLLLESFK